MVSIWDLFRALPIDGHCNVRPFKILAGEIVYSLVSGGGNCQFTAWQSESFSLSAMRQTHGGETNAKRDEYTGLW